MELDIAFQEEQALSACKSFFSSAWSNSSFVCSILGVNFLPVTTHQIPPCLFFVCLGFFFFVPEPTLGCKTQFRDLGFRFWASGFRFWVPGFWLKVFGVHGKGFRFWIWGLSAVDILSLRHPPQTGFFASTNWSGLAYHCIVCPRRTRQENMQRLGSQ